MPVVRVNSIEERPGGAANVALNIAALGGNAAVFGITGDDAEADKLEELLETAGVRCMFHRQTDPSMIRAIIATDSTGN